MNQDNKYKYDVALSFAEEDRNAALALSLAFKLVSHMKAYYYPQNKEEVWGKEINERLHSIFKNDSKCVILMISESYFQKPFVKIELDAIRERMLETPRTTFVFPILLQKNINEELIRNHQEFFPSGRIDWDFDPEGAVDLLLKVLGKKTRNATNLSYRTVINAKNVQYFYYVNTVFIQ